VTTFRDRLVEGWDRVLPASAILGALLMLLAWRRQRRRLKRQTRFDEAGWEHTGA
jgi:hypothetical protein